MIDRDLSSRLKRLAHQLPVITILGPRQSGKTTLARATFPNHTYITLEELDILAHAQDDPRAFLELYRNDHGIILDEIQNAPDLLSYIQTIVDLEKPLGYFILTGSHNFLISQAISQTLAGRMAILTLLPLAIHELKQANLLPETIEEYMFKGSYPRLYDNTIDLSVWFPSYTRNYIERDVRLVQSTIDLRQFHLFLKMCAGRTGQLLNLSAVASDCGIPFHTARSWLSMSGQALLSFCYNHTTKNSVNV